MGAGRSRRRASRLVGFALPLAWGLSACNGAAGPVTDASASDGFAGDGGALPGPDIEWLGAGAPAIVAPALTPCPDGWTESSATGVATCDPYPGAGPSSCAAGQAHFPGEPSCATVGSPCPAGEFSEVLPVDRPVVHVDPGASPGGDGSRATPYASLSDFSLAALSPGSVVALSRGTHTGPVRLVRDVVLWGACAAATTLSASSPSDTDGVVTVRSAQGEVRDTTVTATDRGGIWVFGDGALATLDGVVVDGTAGIGLAVIDGARLSASSVIVRDTRAHADGTSGRGLAVERGGAAELARALLERNRDIGAFATGSPSTVTLSDTAVRDTEARTSDGAGGRGVSIGFGAAAVLARALLAGNRSHGLFAADGPGTAATLSDVVVRETSIRPSDGAFGRGISVQSASNLVVTRVLLDRNSEAGLYVSGASTTATISDLAVTDTSSRDDGTAGAGLAAVGAAVELRRVFVARNREVGVSLDGTGVTAALFDVVIAETAGRTSDGESGVGLGVTEGATAEVARALLERNREAGLLVDGRGSAMNASDVAVRATVVGRGIAVQRGAISELARGLVEQNHEVGVSIDGTQTTLVLTDAVVRDTESRAADLALGRGLSVQGGASAVVTRGLLERNREVGAFAVGLGTALVMSDAVVRDTRPRACADDACVEQPAGHGLGCFDEASLTLAGFSIVGAAGCGLLLARDGQADLSAGEIAGNAVGICLQVDGYDSTRLTDGVRFSDNGTNLQATSLPIPEAVTPLPTSS